MRTHNANKTTKELQNRIGWPQVKLRSASKALKVPLLVHYFFCLFNKNVKTLQKQAVFHLLTECMDGLFHKITEWCIKYGVIKTTEKLLQTSK